MEFEVLNRSDANQWQAILEAFPPELTDVFYCPVYFNSWTSVENAEPLCMYAKTDNYEFLYPFFKSLITEFELDAKYYDIQSAYGYGSVICNQAGKIPPEIIQTFNTKADQWCKENSVVAEFTRENPLFNYFIREADYVKVRYNLYADLQKEYSFSKHARMDIKRAEKKGLRTQTDSELESMDSFIQLYAETAKRIDMEEFYLFPESYFFTVKEILNNNAEIINVIYEDSIIASLLFFHYAGKMNLHLAASDFDHKNKFPNDLLYKSAIERALELNMQCVNLGGGTSTDLNDSLFKFKSKYANMQKDVYIGKKIHDKDIFQNLNDQWSAKYPELTEKYRNFFLKYRMKN
jgi:hypothetical protein